MRNLEQNVIVKLERERKKKVFYKSTLNTEIQSNDNIKKNCFFPPKETKFYLIIEKRKIQVRATI